jgi:hypothetical protein
MKATTHLATACFACVSLSATAAEMTLNRYSRPVAAAEAAGGAPAAGMVHDFYATTSADILSLSTFFNQSVYQHEYGSDHSAPHPELVAAYPALGASSFLDTPGSTLTLGGGFTGPSEKLWGDVSNDGPQSGFLLGRLTTTEPGTFAGQIALRGQYDEVVPMPFSFTLPGPTGQLSETISLSVAEQAPPPPPALLPPDDGIASSPTEPTPSAPAPRPQFDPFANTPATEVGVPVSVQITRLTRSVTDRERAAGAPEGYVHEFLIDTTTDIVGVSEVDLDVPVFQSRFNLDYRPPNAKILKLTAGASADSFITMPGQTYVVGGYANTLSNPDAIWYDRIDKGPADDFLLARITVGETGTFTGALAVAGPTGPVFVPFSFVLPGTAADLALLEGEAPFTFSLGTALPTVQIPEPAALVLLTLALPGLRAMRSGRIRGAGGSRVAACL